MKTKTLIAAILMAAVLFITQFNLNAQTSVTPPVAVPETLPIGDAADLQAYAWEQVSQVGIYGWAASLIRSTTNAQSDLWVQYSRPNGVVDVDEILNLIRGQQLLLSVLYPSDSLTLGVNLCDAEGNNLFYGYTQGDISSPRNGVSRNTLFVVLDMNSVISIPFGAAQRFQIVERDANGNPVRVYHSSEWDVYNGKIRFPAYFANKLGEMRVTLNDGTEVAYNLSRGKKITPTDVKVLIGNVSALGTRTFRGPLAVVVEVSEEEFKKNITPLSQLVNPDGLIHFTASINRSNVYGNYPEFASSVHIWPQGQPSSTALVIQISPLGYTKLWFPGNGRYWVKFKFPSGWPTENQFSPPYRYEEQTVTVSEGK